MVALSISSSARGLLHCEPLDRKSTRLNSSHSQISYAVFCLKKKKTPLTKNRCSHLRPLTHHPSATALISPPPHPALDHHASTPLPAMTARLTSLRGPASRQ